ncbi:MAG: serine/threonine-protein kinase [Myxococcota bacterium]
MPEERSTTGGLVDSVHPTLPRWITGDDNDRVRPPAAVGRYRVGAMLGRGGGGTVFAGQDDALDRDVAIKFVRCGSGSRVAARVLREARALARLSHPNIVHLYDYGRIDETLYLVMELVEGVTLQTWLDDPPGWEGVLRVFLEIARGLAAAHAAGIVHRDFKPSNVIVGGDGRPRVLDFGLARLSSEHDVQLKSRRDPTADPTLTQDGAVMGTPKFMSPEQWGGGEVDAQTDQFSFCLCLFGALYGEPPFAMEDLMLGSSGAPLPPLRVPRTTAVPRALRQVLARGLEQEPTARWPSMDALIDALSRPLHRTRRALSWAGGVLVIAAAGYGWGRDPAPRCGGAANAPQFGAVQQARVVAAFTDTALVYAEDSAEFAIRKLEAFVVEWGEAAERLCLAEARREVTKSGQTRTAACLDRQRKQFDGAVRILAEVDATTLAGSAATVTGLPKPARCWEAAEDAIAPQTRAQIDEAELLRRAARLDEALTLVDAAVHDPEAAGLHVRGRIHEDAGRYAEALEDLRSAYAAAEAEGADELAARTAIDLIRVLGYRLSRSAEAEAFAVTARAKVDRIAPEHHEARADLGASVGRFEIARGRPEVALEALRGAVAMRRSVAPNSLALAADLNVQAQALSMVSQGKLAQASLLEALKIREGALGPEHPLVGSNRLSTSATFRTLRATPRRRPDTSPRRAGSSRPPTGHCIPRPRRPTRRWPPTMPSVGTTSALPRCGTRRSRSMMTRACSGSRDRFAPTWASS